MKKRGISPIIATILLIIMTVGIAALMYTWLTGVFTQLTIQAEQQAGGVGAIDFDLIYVIHDNNVMINTTNHSTFNITLLNKGRVSLNFSRTGGIFYNVEYHQKPYGTKLSTTCRLLNTTGLDDIKPGETATIVLNCTGFNNATTTPPRHIINPDLFRYTITINYLGVVRSITYG